MVKGVGAEKEFVTTFDKNIKQQMIININIQLNYYASICLLVNYVNVNIELDKNVNLGIGQFCPKTH